MSEFVSLPAPPPGRQWCDRCHGSGRAFPGAQISTCGWCDGRGTVPAQKELDHARHR